MLHLYLHKSKKMKSNDDSTTTSSNGENVWERLPIPLSDLFLEEIVPKYLTVQDLVRLLAVSRRYKELLDCSSSAHNKPGKKILASLLRREAQLQTGKGGYYQVCEQLPTIGNGSVDDSLEQDPLTVARLRKATLRRRRLVLIEEETNNLSNSGSAINEHQQQLRQILADFAPKQKLMGDSSARIIARRLGWGPRSTPLTIRTEFVCINQSGTDLFCHWIDGDGDILVRDGDRKPTIVISSQEATGTLPIHHHVVPHPPFVVDHNGNNTNRPAYIFRHYTFTTHSFALCRQEGGPPFAIYQCRRVWHRVNDRAQAHVHRTHVHAIAVLPGGTIRELHCESITRSPRPEYMRVITCTYNMYDRETGALVGGTRTSPNSILAPASIPLSVSTFAGHRVCPQAVAAAKEFYGIRVPDIRHGCWRQNPRAVLEHIASQHNLLNFPSALGEVVWSLDSTTETADGEEDEDEDEESDF